MSTPFTYSDPKRQERNIAGHDREREILAAYKAGEREGGVEIKFDRRRDSSGNWFIEFENNQGNPSGIAITKCLFWDSSSRWDVLRVKVDLLVKYIEQFKAEFKIRHSDEGALGYCIPAEEFRQRLCKRAAKLAGKR
jgi:hypothetical protein